MNEDRGVLDWMLWRERVADTDQTDRAARFVNSHHCLQSRSTTYPDYLPLELTNMSGMNGNLVLQSGSTDERMRLLFYGLAIVPVELLFSEWQE